MRSGPDFCTIVDLLVEDAHLVELKTVESLDDMHRIQCISHLGATGLQLCACYLISAMRDGDRTVVRYPGTR